MSPVVKNGPSSHIVPGCMALEPRRARHMFFDSQTANKKCIGPEMAGKWAVPKLAQLFLSN